MKTREADRRRRNIAAMLRAMFIAPDGSVVPGVTVTGLQDSSATERAAAVKAIKGRLSGGRSDRTKAEAIRRRRLAALAPLARVIHEVLSYEPDGEAGLTRCSRTRLLEELRLWLWEDSDRWEAPEGVSVEATASDQKLWPHGAPSRSAFRDLFRSKSIADILSADVDPAPAERTPITR